MRNVKAGAIQVNFLRIEDSCNIFSKNYKNTVSNIMENHVKKQLDVTLELLEKSGKEGCDIVVSGEDSCATSYFFADITEKNIFPEISKVSGEYAEEKFSEISRKYSMYIVGCYNKMINGHVYNVASVFDRTGAIVGDYRKTHLPPNEIWQVEPGEDINVIEVDFGKIGISICYDMMFAEHAQVLGLKGAEIVFHPTAGYGWYDSIGEATLRTRANDNSFYIVTSKNYVYNGAGRSSVIDFWGQILADAGFYANVTVNKEIDLDFPKTQPDWFYQTHMSGFAQIGPRKLRERRPDLYGILSEKISEPQSVPSKEKQLELYEKVKNGTCRW